ncbi:MAG: hypothetical protein B6241_12505 [Spirochaetaceae bacterium 4572_59]|nr:MAG: hypothetical protein B6241_12505 [Spirochaetaceae bacterium 4572_59]
MENLDKNLISPDRQKTYRNARYKQICKGFISFCADQVIPENMGNEIQWLESLKDQGLSASTIRTYGHAVKSYLLDNRDTTGLTANENIIAEYQIEAEFKSFKLPRVMNRKHREHLVSGEELHEILKHSNLQTRIIIEFLASTGCRVSEMTGIRLSHVRKVRESEFRIRVTGKGSKERVIRINGGLRKRLYKAFPNAMTFLFESSSGKRYTRQGVHDLVKRAGERVSIYGLHPHSFRHFYATFLIDKTGNMDAVSRYLGHSDVATTLGMYYHGKDLTLEELNLDLYGNRGKKRSTANA